MSTAPLASRISTTPKFLRLGRRMISGHTYRHNAGDRCFSHIRNSVPAFAKRLIITDFQVVCLSQADRHVIGRLLG